MASLTDLICPLCGASSKEKEFVKFFCKDCWAKQLKIIVPHKIIVYQCRKCGRMKLRQWKDSLAELKPDIASQIKAKSTKVIVTSLSETGATVDVYFEHAKLERDIPIEIKRSLCDVCTKLARGYYEAIVQLRRGEDRGIEHVKRAAKKLDDILRRRTFIVAVKEFPYGIDMYIGSTQAVFESTRELGLKGKVTRTLHTRKKGKDLYRVTFLIHC